MGDTKSIELIYSVGNSLKKIKIAQDWLVLDLGSGHNPHKRANVLVDNDVDNNFNRLGKPIKIDSKPFIIADALYLPFKDKSVDYILASHIAEHVSNPDLFCRELMRVGKRGYIETPSKIGEKILPEPTHIWYVSNENSKLIFERKSTNKPIVKLFYRLFYFDMDLKGYKRLTSDNKFIYFILKYTSGYIKIFWRSIRDITYICYEWEDKIDVAVN